MPWRYIATVCCLSPICITPVPTDPIQSGPCSTASRAKYDRLGSRKENTILQMFVPGHSCAASRDSSFNIVAFILGTSYFCASIGPFRILKKTGEWRLKRFYFSCCRNQTENPAEFFRYLRIVITKNECIKIEYFILNLNF